MGPSPVQYHTRAWAGADAYARRLRPSLARRTCSLQDHVLFAGGGLPVVSLLDGSSLVLANDSRVYVQVGMQGQSSALVTASLQLQERGVGGSPLRLSPRGPLIEAEAVWPPGSSGSQVVALVLPPGGDSAAASAPGKLQVALTNVTNAELGDARTTALQLEADLPAFGVLSAPAPLYAAELDPDRRDVVRVAFSLGPLQPGAVLHRSVAVDVRLVVLTPEWASLVRLPRASLQWESCGGSRPPCRPQEVAVDILPDALDDTVHPLPHHSTLCPVENHSHSPKRSCSFTFL